MTLLSTALADPDVDRAIRNLREAVRDLQLAPLASALVIPDVTLEDGAPKVISHGLARRPRAVLVSAVRGSPTAAGRIVEARDGINRMRSIKLTATGYGASITVDVVVL